MKDGNHRGGRGCRTRMLLAARAVRAATPALACAAALLALAGCMTSPQITDYQMVMNERPLPPNHILVYDIAATPQDIPSDAPVGARMSPGVALSPEQIVADRQLGTNMAVELIATLRQMGLPAEHAAPGTVPQANDVAVRGCFVSLHAGPTNYWTIGLDNSASEWLVAAEGFQITAQGVGRRPAMSTTAAGADTPGVIFTSGVKVEDKATARARLDAWSHQAVREIAERVKVRFQEQRWAR